MSSIIQGGEWTATFGNGRDKGRGDHYKRFCPAGAFISEMKGLHNDGLGQFTATCSDGTALATYGHGGGNAFLQTCKTGFIPRKADGWDWVASLKMECDRNPSAAIVLGGGGTGGNGVMKCPDGYVASGIDAISAERIGQLRFQCAPGTKETKLACCMANGSGDNTKCREYLPQSTTCDSFMREQAKLSPEEDEFACLKPGSLPSPQCTDPACQKNGYKPLDMDPNNCPPLNLVQCTQIIEQKDADSSSILDNKLTQNCELQVKKDKAKNPTTVTPTSPTSPVTPAAYNADAAAKAADAAAKQQNVLVMSACGGLCFFALILVLVIASKR